MVLTWPKDGTLSSKMYSNLIKNIVLNEVITSIDSTRLIRSLDEYIEKDSMAESELYEKYLWTRLGTVANPFDHTSNEVLLIRRELMMLPGISPESHDDMLDHIIEFTEKLSNKKFQALRIAKEITDIHHKLIDTYIIRD